MTIKKACNLSLLNVIREFGPISKEDLAEKYLPPKQPGIIQGSEICFDSDLKDLIDNGYVSFDGKLYKYERTL